MSAFIRYGGDLREAVLDDAEIGEHPMTQNLVVDGGQLKRLMSLCRLLSAAKGATTRQLQAKLRTSRRTVFRDLNTLAELGIKVDLGDKGYKIKQSPAACKKLLADAQTKALHKFLNACLK